MKKIDYYHTKAGRAPFKEWLQDLDSVSRRKVHAYVNRLAAGAAKKNIRVLGDGVCEIKVNYGGGLRVYFGEVRNELILLLAGGDKGSQFRDIQQAKEYWRDYVSQ